ncbi:MAG TPA: DUF4190 domain-containing protein [Streptosporangiaceae bacterium]|nr:DUF4190 domain-containing protein [Streptosporangiaceae bacterium]
MSSGPEDQPGQDQFGQGPFVAPPGWQAPPPPGPYAQGAGWQAPPPPGPYAQGAGWPQLQGRRTNSLAIASLCCAIGQCIAGPFAGIAAIVLGSMSLRQIQQSGEDGRGMAMTGLVLGIVGLIVFVLLIIFALALFQSAASNSGFSNG